MLWAPFSTCRPHGYRLIPLLCGFSSCMLPGVHILVIGCLGGVASNYAHPNDQIAVVAGVRYLKFVRLVELQAPRYHNPECQGHTPHFAAVVDGPCLALVLLGSGPS